MSIPIYNETGSTHIILSGPIIHEPKKATPKESP